MSSSLYQWEIPFLTFGWQATARGEADGLMSSYKVGGHVACALSLINKSMCFLPGPHSKEEHDRKIKWIDSLDQNRVLPSTEED